MNSNEFGQNINSGLGRQPSVDVGNAFGAASSNGLTRIGLFLGTNIAVVMLVTVVATLLGIDPSGIVGITIFSLLIGMGGAFVSLLMSKGMAKRATRAHVIETPQNEGEKWLVDTVARLSSQAGIGMPEVAIFPSNAPNAFATGAKRDDALVAVSTGLLQSMKRDEVEAVLAHEVAHVANGDMITLTLIQGVVNSLVILIARLVASFVANSSDRGGRGMFYIVYFALQMTLGFFASMIVMWFSRRREFRADAGAASMVGAPPMASALASLARSTGQDPGLPQEVAAFGIRGERGGALAKLLSSHPPIEERIAALRS